jgi:hypothetical protein
VSFRGRYNGSDRAGRVSNRELRRRANAAIAIGTKAYSILLTVLAQKGGEVVITAGTIEQVNRDFNTLDFEVVPNKDIAGEFVVKLLAGNEAGKVFATPQEFAAAHQEEVVADGN